MTDKTIVAAIAAIAGVVSGVSGIKSAPAYPHEQMTESPFAITYLVNNEINIGPVGSKKSLASIAVDVLTVRRDIALDLAILLPLVDTISAALVSEMTPSGDIFSGTIDTFERLLVEFIPSIDYAGVNMIGYRFVMEGVKLLVSL